MNRFKDCRYIRLVVFVTAFCFCFCFLLPGCCSSAVAVQYYNESTILANGELSADELIVEESIAAMKYNRNIGTVRQIPIKSRGNFRIVQISDIHFRPGSLKRYKNAIDLINSSNADLVVFTGDMVTDFDCSAEVADLLRQIVLPCRKIAIRGNWEVNSRHCVLPVTFDFAGFFKSAGFVFLQNQWANFETSFGIVHIFGFDSMHAGDTVPQSLDFPRDGLLILLAHEPARFNHHYIRDYALNHPSGAPYLYMFSGHTHGGQVTLFGAPVFMPKYSSIYQSGRYQYHDNVLYVSAGLGQGRYNARFFADYDIVIADIPCYGFEE